MMKRETKRGENMETMQLFPIEVAKKIKRIVRTDDEIKVNNALENRTDIVLAGVTVRNGKYQYLLIQMDN